MDMSSGEWLADLGNEDASTIIQHCQRMMINSNNSVNMEEFDHLLSRQPTDFLFDETNDFEIVSSLLETKPQLHGVINNNDKEMMIKSEKGINWNSYYTSSNNKSSSERIISFGSLESIKPNEVDLANYESGTSNSNALVKNNRVGSTSLCSREHVLAERKRREKMTERFLALSALIPGLKKMDKATILGDAAKYVKQLEEEIKKQEEQITKTRVESVVLVKKRQHVIDNNNNNNNVDQMVDIEARVCNKNVLIRVHSQKKKGLLQCVLNEIGNLHMSTLNCITMPFGRYAVDITVIAQIDDDDMSMTSNDVVKHLGLALQQFSSL